MTRVFDGSLSVLCMTDSRWATTACASRAGPGPSARSTSTSASAIPAATGASASTSSTTTTASACPASPVNSRLSHQCTLDPFYLVINTPAFVAIVLNAVLYFFALLCFALLLCADLLFFIGISAR